DCVSGYTQFSFVGNESQRHGECSIPFPHFFTEPPVPMIHPGYLDDPVIMVGKISTRECLSSVKIVSKSHDMCLLSFLRYEFLSIKMPHQIGTVCIIEHPFHIVFVAIQW